jgi:tRNA-binding EMAP/Myf-like protein
MLDCMLMRAGVPAPVRHNSSHSHLQEKMLGARVVIVANMKPANMRGIKSHAMVLCASSADGTQVSHCTGVAGSRSWGSNIEQGCLQSASSTVGAMAQSSEIDICRWSSCSRRRVLQWATA